MIRLLCCLALGLGLWPPAAAQTTPPSSPGLWRPATVGLVGTALPVGVGAALLLIEDDGLQGPGWALLVLGTVAGPSMASLALEDYGRAALGGLLRAGAAAGFVAAMDYRFGVGWNGNQAGVYLGNALIAASLGALAYGVAYNFLMLPRSARAQAARLGLAAGPEGGGPALPALVVRF